MAQSVKISDEMMRLVRRESELQSRSIAGQITHWMRIGRAIERSGSFDYARVTAALAGEIETTALTDEEKDVWLDGFTEEMTQVSPEESNFYAQRSKAGLGVGLDSEGRLVQAEAERKE